MNISLDFTFNIYAGFFLIELQLSRFDIQSTTYYVKQNGRTNNENAKFRSVVHAFVPVGVCT